MNVLRLQQQWPISLASGGGPNGDEKCMPDGLVIIMIIIPKKCVTSVPLL